METFYQGCWMRRNVGRGGAGEVEMSSWSSWTGRSVVLEQLDGSKGAQGHKTGRKSRSTLKRTILDGRANREQRLWMD